MGLAKTVAIIGIPLAAMFGGKKALAQDIDLSAAVELSLSHDGALNPLVGGELSLANTKITSILDAGYIGDPRRDGDLSKLFSETHLYGWRNWPICPAGEIDVLPTGDTVYRLGVSSKPIEIGRYTLSGDYYHFATEKGEGFDAEERELWINGGAKLSERTSVYGFTKYFMNKDASDVFLYTIGTLIEIGKGWYIDPNLRNWPDVGGRRDVSCYVGVKKVFN